MITRRGFAAGLAGALAAPSAAGAARRLTKADDAFLEDLSRQSFLFFWEQADPKTGLVRDRALADSGTPDKRNIASSAATGFGLTALAIGASRGWVTRAEARRPLAAALRFYAEQSTHEHGWFYHFTDASSGERVWNCEISSIDTILLLAGILTARQYFDGDAEIEQMARAIWERIDFPWMLNGDRNLLAMGWHPESGFIRSRWDHHCELGILYLLGIASPGRGLPAESWYSWTRPVVKYGAYEYISGAPPLFVHQYSQAWMDFRGRREKRPPGTDWFENSLKATLAHRQFCMDLAGRFSGYSENVWGITASDSAKGYVAWGGPPATGAIDGTVVPCAAAGSLMFAPAVCVAALREMRKRFGERIYKRYGFVDAFHPANGWTNPDVIGIDLGITLLSAENARTGNVWRWFGKNAEVKRVMAELFT